MTDRQTNYRRKIHILTMNRGDDAASLVVPPSGLRGDSMTDRWTTDARKDTRTK